MKTDYLLRLIKNLAISSLMPAAVVTAFMFVYTSWYSFIVGGILFLIYFMIFAGVHVFLKKTNLEGSILLSILCGSLAPVVLSYIWLEATDSKGLETLIYMVGGLGAFGGFYLGWLTKTS